MSHAVQASSRCHEKVVAAFIVVMASTAVVFTAPVFAITVVVWTAVDKVDMVAVKSVVVVSSGVMVVSAVSGQLTPSLPA